MSSRRPLNYRSKLFHPISGKGGFHSQIMFCKWLFVFLSLLVFFFLLLDCRYFYFCIIPVVHGLSVGRLTSDVKYCIKMKIETGSISKGKKPDQGG